MTTKMGNSSERGLGRRNFGRVASRLPARLRVVIDDASVIKVVRIRRACMEDADCHAAPVIGDRSRWRLVDPDPLRSALDAELSQPRGRDAF